MDMPLIHVMVRVVAHENRKNRPKWYSKELRLASLVDSVSTARRNGINARTIALLDSSGPSPYQDLDFALADFDEVRRIKGGSASRSWRAMLRVISRELKGLDDGDIVYFVEDDHLHTKEAITVLNGTEADYTFLYSTDVDSASANGGWMRAHSGVSSFAVRASVLRKDFRRLYVFSYSRNAWDNLTCHALSRDLPAVYLFSQRIEDPLDHEGRVTLAAKFSYQLLWTLIALAWVSKPRSLAACVPNQAAHAELQHLPLGRDWGQTAASIKIGSEGAP